MADNQLKDTFMVTPETKIGTLLDKFPQLESLLISMSPAYKKLNNPILRKTVGKVASLRQVAQTGGFSVVEFVNTIRKEIGLENEDFTGETTSSSSLSQEAPGWGKERTVKKTLDARSIIDSGDSPLNRILTELSDLGEHNVYLLITPFLPAPLLDAVEKKGYSHWSVKEEKEIFKTYITSA